MLGVGRELYGSSSPTPLPKQGHLHIHDLHSLFCHILITVSSKELQMYQQDSSGEALLSEPQCCDQNHRITECQGLEGPSGVI